MFAIYENEVLLDFMESMPRRRLVASSESSYRTHIYTQLHTQKGTHAHNQKVSHLSPTKD